MRNDFCSNYLEHGWLKKGAQKANHKYVARIDAKNGLYRYFYDMKEWLAYLNQNKEKLMEDKINKGVEKMNKLYDDVLTDNKYVTDDYNYDKKVKEIAKTKEWQDIVARKDKEYLKTDKNTGQQYMDIDTYMAKKKHPVLDAVDDVVMGREVSLNKIEKESAIAGAYDYAKTYIALAAIGTEFLLEKFKFSQGSYKDEKQAAIDYVNENKDKVIATASMVEQTSSNPEVIKAISDGEKFIREYGSQAQTIDVNTLSKAAGVSQEDVAKITKDLDTITKDLDKAASVAEKYANEPEKAVTVAKVATKAKQAPKVEVKEEPKATKSEQDFEYKEKIKQPDGTYRYIYEEDLEPKATEPFRVTMDEKKTETKNRTTVKAGNSLSEEEKKKKNKQRYSSMSNKSWQKR